MAVGYVTHWINQREPPSLIYFMVFAIQMLLYVTLLAFFLLFRNPQVCSEVRHS